MQVCHILLLHIPYYFDEKKEILPHFNKNKQLYQKNINTKKQTDEAFCDDITFHILQTPLFMMCTMQVVGFFWYKKNKHI